MSDANLPADPETFTLHQKGLIAGATALDLRQVGRLPEGYKASAAAPFDPRLAYELALEMAPPVEVFEKYGYEEGEAAKLLRMPGFVTTVKKYREEIVAGGVSFKLKARVQAEDLLTHSYEMATDPETPPSVRADLIKWTAAVGDLGPKPVNSKDGGGGGTGAEFALNITFTGLGPAGALKPAIEVVPSAKEIGP